MLKAFFIQLMIHFYDNLWLKSLFWFYNQNHIYEIFFYEMSQRRNLIPLLCSYSIYTCNYVSYFFAVHKMIWNHNTLSCLYVGGGEGVYTLYITLKTFPRSLVKSEDDNPCSTSLLIDIPSSRLEHFNT